MKKLQKILNKIVHDTASRYKKKHSYLVIYGAENILPLIATVPVPSIKNKLYKAFDKTLDYQRIYRNRNLSFVNVILQARQKLGTKWNLIHSCDDACCNETEQLQCCTIHQTMGNLLDIH